MFVQIHKDHSVLLEEYLKANEIPYKISAVPLITSVPVMQYDFESLTEAQKVEIAAVLKQIQTRVKPTRHRPWEDKMHTPAQEFKGWWTGKAAEEEVRYEREE